MSFRKVDTESCTSSASVAIQLASSLSELSLPSWLTDESSVWLARDRQKNRYVSLKVVVAKASLASSEGAILERLRQGNPKHPGRSYAPTLLDKFFTAGPNGKHLCLVGEVAGCSVAQSKEASTKWKFPANIARSIAAQTATGLAYIHSCGVAHAGAPSTSLRVCSHGRLAAVKA
jgi:serine/threonine-protein kinase SRPK3